MYAGAIAVGPHYVVLPDLSDAFSKAKDFFGGNLPEIPKVWDSGDRYTPVLAFMDKFII